MVEYSKRIFHGTLVVVLFTVLSSLVGYGLKFVFAKNLEVHDIGLFFSVLGFVSFFIFLRDLGLSDSLIYFIPKFQAEKSKSKIKSAICFTLSIQFVFGLFFLLTIIIISDFLSKVYFKDSRAYLLLISLALYFVLDGLFETLFKTFLGFQRIWLYKWIEFSFQLVTSVFIVIAILFKLPIISLGIIYIIASISVSLIFFIIFVTKTFPDFYKVRANITKGLRREMMAYSIPAMTGTLANELFSQQTTVILVLFVGVIGVGYYEMMRSLGKVSIYFVSAFFTVYSPMISEFWNNNKIRLFNYYFNKLLIFSFLIVNPSCFTLILFSEEIIRLLYTESYIVAAPLLKFTSLFMLIISFTTIIKRVFLNTGYPKVARNITYMTLFSNLIFSIILIPKFGFVGAGAADLLSAVFTLIYTIYYIKSRSIVVFQISPIVKTVLASLIYLGVAFLLKNILSMNVYLELFIILFISGGIYILFIFILKIITFKEICSPFFIINKEWKSHK